MSKASGPKGVRARPIASYQLPAFGPAPPREQGRRRRLEHQRRRPNRGCTWVADTAVGLDGFYHRHRWSRARYRSRRAEAEAEAA